jgi:hypothetical protein
MPVSVRRIEFGLMGRRWGKLLMGVIQRRVVWRDNSRPLGPLTRNDHHPFLIDPDARKEFEELTQALHEAAIEIMDLADGDPDLEPASDEFQDEDGT